MKGNSVSNILIGLGGDDVLNGGSGADDMRGGSGNDIYYVDNVGDSITENPGDGTDRVNSRIDFVLGSDLENLDLIGSNAIDGTGNELANKINGNSVSNILIGLGGDDLLNGGSGDDKLTGGAGNDIFQLKNGLGRDLITDYVPGEDRIRLLGGISFAGLSFSYTDGHTTINNGDDLLAIVQNTNYSDITFI